MRDLGGNPADYLSRFDIAAGAESQLHTLHLLRPAYAGVLEASADELQRPDFGLRLSGLQGIDVLGPIAVVVRNSETVLDALQAGGASPTSMTQALKVVVERTDTHVRVISGADRTGRPASAASVRDPRWR